MIPIRIRQFPWFLKQMVERHWTLSLPEPDGRVFYLCYFSCRSYFKYLYCSLHSLTMLRAKYCLNIMIFNDDEQPLSAVQVEALRALIPGIRIIDWPKSMGWGAKQIGHIWQAYRMAAIEANDRDIIARVDSDVFFFNDRIFQAVARSNADLIGDGHYVGFKYCQGGCYFFNVLAVHRIMSMLEADPSDSVFAELDVVVEDVAATHFAKRLGLKIWQTWFMMFPDELYNAGSLTTWQRWKFSCVHFTMKNKDAMLDAYEREILAPVARADFRAALNTY
jgi:hypothetical protein